MFGEAVDACEKLNKEGSPKACIHYVKLDNAC